MENINQLLLDISNQKQILLIFIFSISILSYLLMRYVVLNMIFHFFKKTSTQLDDLFIEAGLLNRLSYAVPLIIIYYLFSNLVGEYVMINRLLVALILVVLVSSINSLLTIINELYNRSKYS